MTQLPPDPLPHQGDAPVVPEAVPSGVDLTRTPPSARAPGRGRRALRVLGEATRSVILALLVLLVVRTAVVEAFKIPTSSMEGTLLAGDFLLVNKAVFGAEIPGLGMTLPALAEPMRGEVIVFNPPHEPTKHYVKRLIGLPGDTISMKQKRLFLNGLEIPEPYARYSDLAGDAKHPGMMWQERFLATSVRRGRYSPTRDNWGPLVVPDGRFFVLGDNRDNSEDSRYWGFVERESIRGRPWIVYYSSAMDAAGRFQFLRDVRWTRIGGRVE